MFFQQDRFLCILLCIILIYSVDAFLREKVYGSLIAFQNGRIAPEFIRLVPFDFTGFGLRQEMIIDHPKSRIICKAEKSGITSWVTENLESDGDQITRISSQKAGENDTLPENGLCIGNVRILPAGAAEKYEETNPENMNDYILIRLLVGRNGWGTGVHPTTRLCLEWICKQIVGGESILDYGCGSGVLSIAALHMGASKCIGVDVEAEALVTAERNLQLNGYDGDGKFEALHTREVLPYGITSGAGVDICIANILVGQLVRPSMVAAIVTNLAPGGLLCLSGIRPSEVHSLKAAYSRYIDEWIDGDYAELAASDCEGSVRSYGFDCGTWCRLVGKRKTSSRADSVASMSEQAVS